MAIGANSDNAGRAARRNQRIGGADPHGGVGRDQYDQIAARRRSAEAAVDVVGGAVVPFDGAASPISRSGR
ncbi:hypothetical protein [Schumannella soli]|uniref:Uncharacterized protein n=1 Tax=Schumannella soli TaxID=2590779 RepID=A0A506Y6D2_9MICO|nr:hypothetical protein [Schumannella soli]TPW77140.1 hypothetical protein FJ657_00020 [Schumannella soli]